MDSATQVDALSVPPTGSPVLATTPGEQVWLQPHQSNPETNPNHPLIRDVDGIYGGAPDGPWMSASCEGVTGPYRVFDVLNQEHVGPEFEEFIDAYGHLLSLGGSFAPGCELTEKDVQLPALEADRNADGRLYSRCA